MDIAYIIYCKFKEYANALQIALFLDKMQIFTSCDDLLQKKQLCYILAEHAHLLDGRASATASIGSARQNLTATFVNAFVNAGFGQDKLMTVQSDSSSSGRSLGNWLFKNKEHGKASAAASLGTILLWDADSGLAQLNKYFHGSDTQVLAGALLGVGIVNRNIKNECDPEIM